jgi:hypothetical protein
MALTAGTRLGPYEIVGELGVGGMGEVYRATDTSLKRHVAIKVLPGTVASDAERLARFQREAEVLARLNHPNIAQIYGVLGSAGTTALVMELVDGPTLADRIAQGAIPLDEALPIAKQMAEALESAHEQGIVHRDLKPANVKVRDDGTVKVLDFGLAKVLDPRDASAADLANSPTMAAMTTQAGVILGTAAYVSPEQARGQRIDRRADIWAFGCVLFEMLSGRRAFEGDTISDVVAAVIRAEPEWQAIPATTPPAVERLLRRCLRKDARQRLRDIGDARVTIEETIAGEGAVTPLLGSTGTPAPDATPALRRRGIGGRILLWAAVSLLIGLAAVAGWSMRGRRSAPARHWSADLLAGSTIAFAPRISPDGRTLAFEAIVDNETQVAVTNPDSGNWTVLTHDRSHGPVHEIAWSPDGSTLYFDRVLAKPVAIYSIPSLGGDARLVLQDAAGPEPLPNGSLLVWRVDDDRRERLYHFWPDSGRIEPLGGWIAPTLPVALARVFPDGREAVFYGWDANTPASATPSLFVIDLSNGQTRRFAPQLPIRLTSEGLAMAPTTDNRSLLVDLPSRSLHQIVSIPRSGSGPVEPLMTLTAAPWIMDAAPDGSIYVDQVDRPFEILRFPISGDTPDVLASSPAHLSTGVSAPVEFSDGRVLIPATVSGRSHLLIGRSGGSFFPLSKSEENGQLPAILLPGDQVAFVAGTGADQTIAIASAANGQIVRRLRGCKGTYVTSLAASRDGRTLYYSAEGTIWTIPAADGTPRKIVSGDGVAVDPDGRGLIVNAFEKSGQRLFRAPLSGGSPQPIPIQDGVSLVPLPLSAHSLRSDGKLLVGLTLPDSWFFTEAVLDVPTGRVERIPLTFTGDVLSAAWAADGRILALAEPMQAHIWRYRPVTADGR